jgi:PrtD family type I secretion system ABC transporter
MDRPGAEPSAVRGRLAAELKRPLLAVAGFSLLVNLLLLAPALFMLQVFDRVIASGSRETLATLLIGTAVALLMMFALDYLRARLQGVAGQIVGEFLSPLIARITLADRARMDSRSSASVNGLRDVALLRNVFASQGLLALFDAPWLVVYLCVIALAHPALGLAATGAALWMLGLALVNDRLTRRGIEAVQHRASRSSRYLEASLANAEVVQTLGMADALLTRWGRLNASVAEIQGPLARRSVAMAALTRTTRQAVQVVMLALGAWLVITQQSSAGVMIGATILLGRALAPVEQLVGNWRVLADGRAAFRRLAALLNDKTLDAVNMRLPVPRGALRAEGLMWRPRGSDRLVLGGVSFELAAGESLAIIGPSGAGKSTVLPLLAGLWAPTVGVVRLDAADVAHWPRDELGPHIGYVPQDVELFAGTVAENISRLGDVDATMVVDAARRARVHDMILSLPAGYETMVDPQDALLSPGQRQRIALARALYGAPALLLLDEPNANLDGADELALGQSLSALAGSVTVVVVTHRTTLAQQVDKMLVLEGGRVLHYGRTAEVLAALHGPRAGGQVVVMPRASQRQPNVEAVGS